MVYKKGHVDVYFYVGSGLRRKYAVEGDGLYSSFREQNIYWAKKYLQGFYRRRIDSLGQQLAPKWNSMNAERVLAVTDATCLLVIMCVIPQTNTSYKGNTEAPLLTQSSAMLRRGKVLACMNQDDAFISKEKGLRGLFIRLQHLIINFAFVVRALFV